MLKQDFDISAPLGAGIYGISSRCRNVKIPGELVIQEILLSSLAKSEKDDIIDESELFLPIKHPNVVKYHKVFIDKNSLCIVTDYNDGTTLYDNIRNAAVNNFDEDTILMWFVQLCYAVKYLHDHNILHRNLHLSNIVLTRHNTIKLSGLAFAKILDHSSDFKNTSSGTPYNVCPEVCLGLQYSQKSDVWGLGIILYRLCALSKEQFSPVVCSALIGNEINIPDMYSDNLKNLIAQLTERDQENRPSIDQILNIDFIRSKIDKLFKTFINRLEYTTPASERFRGNIGMKRPNLGGASSNLTNNASNSKKIKNRFGSKKPAITQPKSALKPRKPLKQKPIDLSVQAVLVDPQSFHQHRIQPKYDIMQTKSTIEQSELVLDGSCKTKEEFYELRAKEIRKKQKENKKERLQRMHELSLEAKKRLKEFDQLEAPFKKIKDKSHATNRAENEDLLLLAVEAARPPHVGSIKNYTVEDREREINLLADLISQKREEVQHNKKLQELDDDTIMIGNVEVTVEKPKNSKGSAASSSRSYAPNLTEISAYENNDLISVAAISKNFLNVPPSIDSEEPKISAVMDGITGLVPTNPNTVASSIKMNKDKTIEIDIARMSHETGFFYFNSLPIDIPGVDMYDIAGRIDCLVQFIEQGLGPDLLDNARQLVFEAAQMSNEAATERFKEVFTNPEEAKYYPFVQHLIFCEHFNE